MYIASVNMQKRNTVIHALLNSNDSAYLILIQEPWFNQIGTARKDNARQGVDILGGVASPKWELVYSGLSEEQTPKVMIYIRKPFPQLTNAPWFIVVTDRSQCLTDRSGFRLLRAVPQPGGVA